jgi:hypothetical protein
VLSAIVCVGVLLCSGCSAAAPATLVPHENPATAGARYSPGALFLYVGRALQELALGEYGTAQEMLSQVGADEAHVPEALRRICVRYVELCDELARTLDDLDAALSAAERLLETNETAPARAQLEESRQLIDVAGEQLNSLESATDEALALAGRYGTGAARAAVTEAKARLDEAMQRLRELTAEYLKRLDVDSEQLERRGALEMPALTCTAGADAVWVGEDVIARGALSTRRGPLGGRTVQLLVDGVPTYEAVTDSGGAFLVRVTTPFSYAPRLTLQARFAPQNADLDLVQSAASVPVVLTVRYYESVIDVDIPGELHPGLSATLTGQVHSMGAVAGRPVEVLLDDDVVGQTTTFDDGAFFCRMETPAAAVEGEAQFVVQMPAVDEAQTGPANRSTTLRVGRVAPSVSLGFPSVVLVPGIRLLDLYLGQRGLSEDGLPVRTTIESSLPFSEPVLVARIGDETVRLTGERGQSWVTFPLRYSIWTVGVQSARLDVVPDEPWHRPVRREVHFLVVNLLLVGLALVVLVGVVLMMAFVRRRQIEGVVRVPAGVTAPVGALVSALPVEETAAASHRQAVVRLYLAAARRVEALTGLAFGRTVTLREFLAACSVFIGRAGSVFARLTTLAEEALYSKHDIGATDVARSRELAGAVGDEAAREGSTRAEGGKP